MKTFKTKWIPATKTYALMSAIIIVSLSAASMGKGPIAPPKAKVPNEYQNRLEKVKDVEELRSFLSETEDKQFAASAKMAALQKLTRLTNQKGAVELLTELLHEEAYTDSGHLSRHIKEEIIRTFGEIRTQNAKDALLDILNNYLTKYKEWSSTQKRAKNVTNIIDQTMSVLSDTWYMEGATRSRLKTIAQNTKNYDDFIRITACENFLKSKMKLEELDSKSQKVEWLVNKLNYNLFKKQEFQAQDGNTYTYYATSTDTWAGIVNKAAVACLKDLSPDEKSLQQLKAQLSGSHSKSVINYLIKQTQGQKRAIALNYIWRAITEPSAHTVKWWGARVGIPSEKALSRKSIQEAVDMVDKEGLTLLLKRLDRLEKKDIKRPNVYQNVKKQSKQRLASLKEKSSNSKRSSPDNKKHRIKDNSSPASSAKGVGEANSKADHKNNQLASQQLWILIIGGVSACIVASVILLGVARKKKR